MGRWTKRCCRAQSFTYKLQLRQSFKFPMSQKLRRWQRDRSSSACHVSLTPFLRPPRFTPGCFWERNARLIQRLCSATVCHTQFLHCNMVQVKPCGLQAEQIAGINVSTQRCYLPPCPRDRTIPHISAFLSTKVCRQKTIFYWKSYRQASTFNPELALQCLSDPPEEFKAHCIFCVCALVILSLKSFRRP